MPKSPFLSLTNSLLKFAIASGEMAVDRNGNLRPAEAVLEVRALLDQAKDEGQSGLINDEIAGAEDGTPIYLEGYATDPMLLPGVVGLRSEAEAMWQGVAGKFILGIVRTSPYGDTPVIGHELKGYFVASSYTVSGDPWQAPPPPTPQPSGNDQQFAAPMPAGVSLSALRVVTVNNAGGLIYASSNNASHANAVVGITTTSAAVGDAIAPLVEGQLSDPAWNWNPGSPLFLGLNGLLTQAAPDSGFVLQVARAIRPNLINFEIQEPILL